MFLLVAIGAVGANAETPFIVRGSKPGTDVVQYTPNPGAPLEAWEIVLYWADGTYLNYSRGWYGSVGTKAQPMEICFTKTEGKKFVGIGYDVYQLQSALSVVIADALGASADPNTNCAIFSDLLLNHSEYKDLEKYFDSL